MPSHRRQPAWKLHLGRLFENLKQTTVRRRSVLGVATIAVIVPMIGASPVAAAPAVRFVQPVAAAPVQQTPSTAVVSVATKGAAVKGSGVWYPNRGEGIISVVARACGSSATWSANAAANGIRVNTNPPYLLLYGQALTIDCQAVADAAPPPPPVVVQAPAPVAVPAAWVRPIAGSWCFQPNGSREYGVGRPGHMHAGIDLGSPVGAVYGTPIHAIHSGVAHWGSQPSGAGLYIYLEHGDGTYSAYFHMSSRAVSDGTRVSAGQVIGYVGASGNARGAHLHFETHMARWGSKVDPVKFLADRGVSIRC